MSARSLPTRILAAAAKQALWLGLRGRVASGPFGGMRYIRYSIGSAFGAKLVGTYERELGIIIESLPAMGFLSVIDLGAAEGYYAVGLARLLRCPVTAYEMEVQGRSLLAEMARRNGVESLININGLCETADLLQLLAKTSQRPCLMVCDIEGFERHLLDPDKIPGLRDIHLLVEVHERIEPGVQAELERRFSSSHALKIIATEQRQSKDFPNLPLAWLFPFALKQKLMEEHRDGPMNWLWMVPRVDSSL